MNEPCIVTASALQRDFGKWLAAARRGHPVIVTNQQRRDVVLLDIEVWEGLLAAKKELLAAKREMDEARRAE